MPRPSAGRRIVVTGLGCVSPIGATADATWNAAVAGRSGRREIRRFEASQFPVRIAAGAPDDFDLGDLPGKEIRRLDRFILFALAAAREALLHAGLAPEGKAGERTGVAIGSGIGGLETLSNSIKVLKDSGPRRVSDSTAG